MDVKKKFSATWFGMMPVCRLGSPAARMYPPINFTIQYVPRLVRK